MTFPTFAAFFSELNGGHAPFPWQSELADRACAGNWPQFITSPTGSGKTTCLEVAVYALAAQAHLPPAERSAPRRIFFIVNRRVIVDEAFARARRMTEALAKPASDKPACAAIAEALRLLNPIPFPHQPLDCVQLRGAIFRDQRWARSLLQPTLIATTVDQVGSRMLFRGYGVSQNARPIHAALVATDALWILDEAHISRPFAETVETLQRYQEHHLTQNRDACQIPSLRWVQMTATPPKGTTNTIGLAQADFEHPILNKRLEASKPARLILSQAKTAAKQQDALAEDLLEQTAAIIAEHNPRSLAIMVNRVITARNVADRVEKENQSKKARFHANVSLLIGRMRPVDRDSETPRIQAALEKAAQREPLSEGAAPPPVEIVVSTQCLEVGADLDFDALVTECASLDALRQRFGRLNRTGRKIPVCGAIVMPSHLIETDRKKLDKLAADNQWLDPIYGNALSETWNWLQTVSTEGTVDFGLTRMGALVDNLIEAELNRLQAPTSSAPTLFPSYLDAWAQTNPAPWPDPDPALFLHGKQTARPDILVVWRADLPENLETKAAAHDISLCPPSQVEALPVPLHVFRDWFFQVNAKTASLNDAGDLLDAAANQESPKGRNETKEPRGFALLWRGPSKSMQLSRPEDLHPGDTIILPLGLGGWSHLGHVPNAPVDPGILKRADDAPTLIDLLIIDRAEEAFRTTRDRAVLRLRPELFQAQGSDAWKTLLACAADPESNIRTSELRRLLEEASSDESLPESLQATLASLAERKSGENNFTAVRYADECGIVFTTRRRLHPARNDRFTQAEDENDEWSRTTALGPINLQTHTKHVSDLVQTISQALGLDEEISSCLMSAAELHDWGKIDPRFQALLLGGNPHAAYALAEPLAKSDRLQSSAREADRARELSGLPKGFRHELASLPLASHQKAANHLPGDPDLRDLVLHLVASHHGYARPFAPVIDDPNPSSLNTENFRSAPPIHISGEDRAAHPAHRLDSGIPDRFWRLLRRHGPWGLAFLETILRLADQQASEAESEGWYADTTTDLETSANT